MAFHRNAWGIGYKINWFTRETSVHCCLCLISQIHQRGCWNVGTERGGGIYWAVGFNIVLTDFFVVEKPALPAKDVAF